MAAEDDTMQAGATETNDADEPEEESIFYSRESNLLVNSRVSEVMFTELTRQYGFVAGSQREYES